MVSLEVDSGAERETGEPRLLQLVYYGYRAAAGVARALPEPLAYDLAHRLGSILARTSKKRAVVERNLARITGREPHSPEVQDLVRRAFRSYAEYWLETFRLVQADRGYLLDRFTADGEQHLLKALERGRGAVIVMAHLGNYDAGAAWAAALTGSLVTVAEVLRPRKMFEFFAEHRQRLGMTILPARAGITNELVAAARAGHAVGILGDRDFKGTGVEVMFFGEPTTFPPGPAAIALRSGAPLLVAGIHAERRGAWRASITPPIEVPDPDSPTALPDLTRRIAEELELQIARHPEEWHVFQPFWTADRKAS